MSLFIKFKEYSYRNNNQHWNYSTILVCCDTKNAKKLHLLIANAHLCHVCDSYEHCVNINLDISCLEMGWFSNKLNPMILNRHLRLPCSGFLLFTVSSEKTVNQSYTMHFSISRRMCQKSLVIYEITVTGWEQQPFLSINCNFWLPSEKKKKKYYFFGGDVSFCNFVFIKYVPTVFDIIFRNHAVSLVLSQEYLWNQTGALGRRVWVRRK